MQKEQDRRIIPSEEEFSLEELKKKLSSLMLSKRNLENEIKNVEEQIKFYNMTDEQRLAIRLHESSCNWNHTDGCGWYYEVANNVHNWSGRAHQQYLGKATKLICKCKEIGVDPNQAINIFSMVKASS